MLSSHHKDAPLTDMRGRFREEGLQMKKWSHARTMRGVLQTLLPVVYLLVVTEKSAHAYTDPGSGSLILQMLIAGALGSLFYVRKVATWIKKKVSKD